MKKKPYHKPGSQLKLCAIYARAATVKMPSEDNSISHQVAACNRFARERGWTVMRDYIFIDSGRSGLTVNSGLSDLMRSAAANPKPFEVLLCTSTDRIARDSNLEMWICETLNKHGVEIWFAESEGIVATSI